MPGRNRTIPRPGFTSRIAGVVLLSSLCAALFFAGCGPKPLSKATERQVTREIAGAAEQITSRKSAITVRIEPETKSLWRGSRPGADDLSVALNDAAQEEALRRAIARIARKHGLSLTEARAGGVVRIDLAFRGTRTHSVRLTVREAQPGGPRLAIILDDMGYDQAAANAVFGLPFRLTVSVLPNLPLSSAVADQAYRRGDQVLLHLPMQPQSAGAAHERDQLTVGMGAGLVGATLAEMLRTVPHAVGVNNHEGSRATADPALMRALMESLRADGLFFVDSRTTAQTVAYTEAEDAGVAAASRNVFLDDVASQGAILKQLDLAARDAVTRGSAIAIGHPRPATIAALAKGVPRLKDRGVRLAPASELVHIEAPRRR